MKLTFIYSLTFFILLSFAVDAKVINNRHPRKHKKVVLVRPVRPHVKVFKPVNLKSNYIWIDGYWKWNRKTQNYVWVGGHLIKRKRGKVWVGGHWERYNGGWRYASGKWA